jgi:hypothetical protein
MENICLPRYVIDRLEHRWASRLQQPLNVRRSHESRTVQRRHAGGTGTIPVIVKRRRAGNTKTVQA